MHFHTRALLWHESVEFDIFLDQTKHTAAVQCCLVLLFHSLMCHVKTVRLRAEHVSSYLSSSSSVSVLSKKQFLCSCGDVQRELLSGIYCRPQTPLEQIHWQPHLWCRIPRRHAACTDNCMTPVLTAAEDTILRIYMLRKLRFEVQRERGREKGGWVLAVVGRYFGSLSKIPLVVVVTPCSQIQL